MAWALKGTKQAGFTPIIEIRVNGREVAGAFYSRLIKVTIRDEAGQTSDSVTFDLDDRSPAIALPAPKATIQVSGGWKEGDRFKAGTFEMQSIALKGDADAGESITIQGSAADLKTRLKGSAREGFEDKTVGEIVETYAKRAGMTARVDPDLAKIKIPYRARVDSAEMGFLTVLADELDAVAKPMGDQLVFAKRGSAKAVSGQNLPPILIEKSDCSSWEVAPDALTQYGQVKAAYIDQKTGKRTKVEAKTGLKGPVLTIRDPLPNEEQAKKAAEAEARRLTRNTGSGHFQLATGRFDAQAEADVVAGGSFRTGIRGDWRAEAVEHVFDEKGWRTKVEIKAKEDGSSSGKDEK